MMMNIIDCPDNAASIGMKVRIVFENRDGQNVPQAMPDI